MMNQKLWGLLLVFAAGVITTLFLTSSDADTASRATPTDSFGPGSLLAWGLVIIILLTLTGIGVSVIIRILAAGRVIQPTDGLFPLIRGRLRNGEQYIYDPNRAPAALTVFDARQGRAFYIDGGPEAARIVSQAQITQALSASRSQLNSAQLTQALGAPPAADLPPILPLPDEVSVSHLDALLDWDNPANSH